MGRREEGVGMGGEEGLGIGRTVPRENLGGRRFWVTIAVKRRARRGAQVSLPTRQRGKGRWSWPGAEDGWVARREEQTSAVVKTEEPAAAARWGGMACSEPEAI
jgi:hypothetical protein